MPGNDLRAGSKNRTPDDTLRLVAGYALALERLERGGARIDADQYRLIVDRLAAALRDANPDDHLRALLSSSRAASELYENLRYEHAGLCLRPLEKALAAETKARAWIDAARAAAAR